MGGGGDFCAGFFFFLFVVDVIHQTRIDSFWRPKNYYSNDSPTFGRGHTLIFVCSTTSASSFHFSQSVSRQKEGQRITIQPPQPPNPPQLPPTFTQIEFHAMFHVPSSNLHQNLN